MKRARVLITFVVCVLVQIQLARKFSFVRQVPAQLLLIATIYYCLDRDWYAGMLVGVCAGVVLDLFAGERLGVFALSYGVIGLSIGSVQGYVFKDSLPAKLLFVFAGTLMVQALSFYVIRNFQPNMSFFVYLYRSILPGAGLNCLVAVPFFLVVRRIRTGTRRVRV